MTPSSEYSSETSRIGNSLDIVAILKKSNPSVTEKKHVMLSLTGEPNETKFEDYKTHFERQISHFDSLTLPDGYGLEGFDLTDVITYLLTPSKFHFSLKKEAGRGILYGRDHAATRRAIINHLSESTRLFLVRPKLKHIKLIDKINNSKFKANHSPQQDYTYEDIISISDIGMAHSVYLIQLQNNTSKPLEIVIKEEKDGYQEFYCKLLAELELPSFQSQHFKDESGDWELSEYLGKFSLNSFFEQNIAYDYAIAKELAKQAALGDILGRGDRHFENYVICKGHLYPVDISILFWPNNEEWLERYASANNNECNVVNCFQAIDDITAEENMSRFNDYMKEYELAIKSYEKREPDILTLIHNELSDDPDVLEKQQYIREKLSNINKLIIETKQRNLKSIIESKKRYIYKDLLQKIVQKQPNILDKYPWLKMYYLADKDRQSAFFLVDDKQDEIYKIIEELAQNYLNKSALDIHNQLQKIDQEYN